MKKLYSILTIMALLLFANVLFANDFTGKEKRSEAITVSPSENLGANQMSELSKVELSVLKKFVSYAFEELSNRTCNDVDESDLSLSQEEKEFTLSFLNTNIELDPGDEPIENINYDMYLSKVVFALLNKISEQKT